MLSGFCYQPQSDCLLTGLDTLEPDVGGGGGGVGFALAAGCVYPCCKEEGRYPLSSVGE